MLKDKREFDVDGVRYAVRRPTFEEFTTANQKRAAAFNESLQRGDLLRDQLDNELRKRDLWNDDREKTYQDLRQNVIDGEFVLSKGGIKLERAKETALKMSDSREEMVELLSSRSELDQNTCEGKADSVRFNYLFSCCLVYDETGEPFFPKGLIDYLANQNSEVSVRGATEFYYLLSDTEAVDDKLPENNFLKQYEFVNEKYQLVDEKGRLVDREGSHINEYGQLINWIDDETYELVDGKGRTVTDEGDFQVEFAPFLDEKGDPVLLETETEEAAEEDAEVEETEEEPKPKPKTKKKIATTARKKVTKKKVAKPEPEKNEEETEPEHEPEAESPEEAEETAEESTDSE